MDDLDEDVVEDVKPKDDSDDLNKRVEADRKAINRLKKKMLKDN